MHERLYDTGVVPDSSAELQVYGHARDEQFNALVTRLEADERIRAAWLSGAHGRGEDDEWSDFDFHVAVRDGDMQSVLGEPMSLFRLAGRVLLVQGNFPSDSMPDGRFWLVVYAGPWAIDWNIGPASAAVRPRASRVLFEKEMVRLASDPAPLTRLETQEQAQKALEFFWAMAPIAVKYAGRGRMRRAVQQEALLAAAWQRLWELAHRRVLRTQDAYDQNRPPSPRALAAIRSFDSVITGEDVVRVIGEYCDAMEPLHPGLACLGVDVPIRMPAEVRRLIEIARIEIQRGSNRPGSGSRR
jgi:hypothetical protein